MIQLLKLTEFLEKQIKPFLKSVCITLDASGAFESFNTVQALVSFSPVSFFFHQSKFLFHQSEFFFTTAVSFLPEL